MMEIKSKDLKKLIALKLRKKMNDEIEENELENELENVKNISINSRNIVGEATDIKISELKYLENLESCIISNFEIAEEDIDVLNNLASLKTLQFTCCSFKSKKELKNITTIIVEACKDFDFDNNINKENIETVKIVNYSEVDMKNLKSIRNTKKLYLINCNVSNIKKVAKFSKLEYLNTERSSLDNEKFLEKLGKKIKVEK